MTLPGSAPRNTDFDNCSDLLREPSPEPGSTTTRNNNKHIPRITSPFSSTETPLLFHTSAAPPTRRAHIPPSVNSSRRRQSPTSTADHLRQVFERSSVCRRRAFTHLPSGSSRFFRSQHGDSHDGRTGHHRPGTDSSVSVCWHVVLSSLVRCVLP